MSQLVLIVGSKGTGKSTTLAELALGLQRKTLIIDPGRAPVYGEKGFAFISQEEIKDFSRLPENALSGVDRIRRISKVINVKRLIAEIYGYDFAQNEIYYGNAFVNGNLIMEDAASYVGASITETLRQCIKAMKQYGLNLILSYHSIGEISNDILGLSPDKLIFKKTADTQKVFTKIDKTKRFRKQTAAMEAYYLAQFFGFKPEEILENFQRFLPGIAMDLFHLYQKPVKTLPQRKAFARFLCKWTHGQAQPSKAQRKIGLYKPFSADMTLRLA